MLEKTNPIFDTVVNFTTGKNTDTQHPTQITLFYLIRGNFEQHREESLDSPKIPITPYQLKRIENRLTYLFKEAKSAKEWQLGDKPLFDMPYGKYGYGPRLYELAIHFMKEAGQWGSKIKRFEVVEPLENPLEISLSTSVKLEDKIQNKEISMNIVTEDLAFEDLSEFPISHPLILPILGKRVNDKIKFKFQERRFDYEILSITKYNPEE